MPTVTFRLGVDVTDPRLAARWRELEQGWDVPVFRRWCWVGCLAARRFTDPVLAEVYRDGVLAGLGLFNRRSGLLGPTLHLNESGEATVDSVFVEHNGLLCARVDEAALTAAVLLEAGRLGYRVALPGIDADSFSGVRGARGIVEPLQTRGADYVRLPSSEDGYLRQVSRNTRAQLRRSDRAYEAWGPIAAMRAADAKEALTWLEAMLDLHLRTWATRGTATAFTLAPAQAFVRTLVQEGMPRGEVEVVRVAAGDRPVGYLLNLRSDTSVSSYQSGFDYDGAPEHGKPGYTCHLAAIRAAIAAGMEEYDFLAGDARYKRSLSTASRAVHWLTWQRRASIAGMVAMARQMAQPATALHKFRASWAEFRQG